MSYCLPPQKGTRSGYIAQEILRTPELGPEIRIGVDSLAPDSSTVVDNYNGSPDGMVGLLICTVHALNQRVKELEAERNFLNASFTSDDGMVVLD